ncbi:hypothetical protein AC1031_016526 [Aphanomyces cochlioides]|nr:hypothetical protein AC1031_016526 [Aphanomyces cochlioides]
MRLLIVLALTSCAAMAFNQPPQDSPVMMAHEQVAIDSVLYNDRALKGEGKKQKGRKHDKKAKGYGPDQAASEKESEASPARELKAMNRAGKYQKIGHVVGGAVCCVAGGIAAAAAATTVSQHALDIVGRRGVGPSIAAQAIVSSGFAGASAGLRAGSRWGGNLGQKLDNKLARSSGRQPRRVSP